MQSLTTFLRGYNVPDIVLDTEMDKIKKDKIFAIMGLAFNCGEKDNI